MYAQKRYIAIRVDWLDSTATQRNKKHCRLLYQVTMSWASCPGSFMPTWAVHSCGAGTVGLMAKLCTYTYIIYYSRLVAPCCIHLPTQGRTRHPHSTKASLAPCHMAPCSRPECKTFPKSPYLYEAQTNLWGTAVQDKAE
jgi:hypothetical protein